MGVVCGGRLWLAFWWVVRSRGGGRVGWMWYGVTVVHVAVVGVARLGCGQMPSHIPSSRVVLLNGRATQLTPLFRLGSQ